MVKSPLSTCSLYYAKCKAPANTLPSVWVHYLHHQDSRGGWRAQLKPFPSTSRLLFLHRKRCPQGARSATSTSPCSNQQWVSRTHLALPSRSNSWKHSGMFQANTVSLLKYCRQVLIIFVPCYSVIIIIICCTWQSIAVYSWQNTHNQNQNKW